MTCMDDEIDDPTCPECDAGKHSNCNGTAWSDTTDQLTECGCLCRSGRMVVDVHVNWDKLGDHQALSEGSAP